MYRYWGGVGTLRRTNNASKRSRTRVLGLTGVLAMAGIPTAMGAAASGPDVASPPTVVPSGLGGLVTALLEQLPLFSFGPTPSPSTTIPGEAVADEAPEVVSAVGLDLPPLPTPIITAPTIPPPPVTAAPVPAPASASAPAFANTQVGIASWYNDRDGHCAHRTAPIGTVVTVTNVATGSSVTCKVTNRGPYAGGRIIDLSDGSFARIAPLSQGLADVRVEW